MTQYDLNLRDYIRIFRRRRAVIVLTFLAVIVASRFFTQTPDLFYQAESTIKIEERKTIAGLLTEWIVFAPGDMMESQARQIHGYQVLRKTAIRLGLLTVETTEQQANTVTSQLAKQLKTEKVGATNIIRIVATASTPVEAITIANTVVEVFMEENLREKTQQARSGRQFIEEQLISLEERMREREDMLRSFTQGRRQVMMAQTVQEKIAELQFELSSLLQKYTEKHPLVIELRQRIQDLEAQNIEVADEGLEYNRLSRAVETDQKLFIMLKEKLEEARINEAQKVGDISVVTPAVTAEAVTGPNRIVNVIVALMLGLVLGFALALILESIDTSIGTIEDVEKLIKVPVLGIIPSVSGHHGRTFGNQLMKRFRQQVLHKPKTHEEERQTRLVVQFNPSSPVAEAYRNVYTNLKLDGSAKTFLVTSSGPREGKSTILSNLGLTIAQAGMRTLIVSADIRRPVLARTFGIAREPGLTEVILGIIPLEEAVRSITDMMLGDIPFDTLLHTPGIDNLWVLTSGQLPFNPAKLLESRELEMLISRMRERFDVVLFDSPPVLPVTDASLLGSRLDAAIMVYEIGRTSRDALWRAKNQLDSVGAKVMGVILNQTRSETETEVIYPYYQKYKYYREDEPAEKEPAPSSLAAS